MTPTRPLPTPGNLADFDAAMRNRALEQGKAVLRMAQPGAPRRQSQGASSALFVFSRNGRLMCARPGEVPVDLTSSLIADAIEAVGATVVPTGPAVANQIANMLNAVRTPYVRGQPDPVARARRTVGFALTCAVSSRVVVLTSALARKFYAPTGMTATNLRQWSDLLWPIGKGDPASGMAGLLGLVWDDTSSGVNFGRTQPGAVICDSEKSAESAANFGGVSMTATQYAASEAISQAWGAIERADPVLRHRCVAEGSVVRIRPALGAGGITAQVLGATKLKEGADLMITRSDSADPEVRFARLSGYRIDGDSLVMSLVAAASPGRKGASDTAGMHLLTAAAQNGSDVLVSEKPFLMAAQKAFFGPWSGTTIAPEHRVVRTVPLDVMMAGA